MIPPFSRTLPDLLRERAASHAEATAVICGDRSVTYAGLYDHARRIAGGLRSRGIRRGDRVAVLMNNRLEWAASCLGAMLAGATVVALSTWSRRDELEFLLEDSRPTVLICIEGFAGQDYLADLATMPAVRPTLIVLLADHAAPGTLAYEALLASHPLPPLMPGETAGPADDAVIIYTSGSSSRPKSVPLAQYGIIENGFHIGERMGLGPDDRVLVAPPLFWSYGNANAMSATLTHGATLVLQSRFEPGEALNLIERHRCTAVYTLPAMTGAMLAHPDFAPARTASLRTGLTIGAPQDIITAAERLGAAEICNIYGQTESYGNCCVTPHDWPLAQRAACQGPPLPGVTVRIIDADSGAVCAPGQDGMIEVKGYILRSYLGASTYQNAEALTEDGFFRTGDLGHLTAAGHLVFAGRTTEMVKKGGINISPAEVEDVLLRHPAVAQVGVVGVPDAVQGEILAAYVVPRAGMTPTAAELLAHCKALASRYKVPDRIEFRTELPVTVTGKLMRRELKAEAAASAKAAS